MIRLIEIGVLVFIVVFALLVWNRHLNADPSRVAEQLRRNQDAARWEVDDTGTTDGGQAVMAIRLVAPGVTEPYGYHQVGQPYEIGDDLAWVELSGRARGLAKDLNERIDLAQDRRR